MADQATVSVYEQRAAQWRAERGPKSSAAVEAFAALDRPAGITADLGCGPGWHTSVLPQPALAVDAARSMLEMVSDHAPDALRCRADLAALPLAAGSLAGAWASRSYVHLDRRHVPLALADLHRALAPGAPVELHVFEGDADFEPFSDDDFPGRRFSQWPRDWIAPLMEGAGFALDGMERMGRPPKAATLVVRGRRAQTLPDTVGPDMRLLVCGLNPSVYAADAGAGFARPGNRFWPAALAAGLVSTDRSPRRALIDHGMGMTDLVKRATPRADALTSREYRQGLDRLSWLAGWLKPAAVCFVGLAGWRAAVDRKAQAGPQSRELGGCPVYVMPSTSGAAAGYRLADYVSHLRQAAALAT
ncbi:uracil-DNA glycosylase family protein [Candidatus Poriferisocius sp.]|uniref:uracil-DNA glycosylase family protein n=1 Tax=Candidatus Poriferisocius sp. TaxID=3101276 RepID=UPI003B0201B3